MNVLFMYDCAMNPEKGGTERATWLVMQELQRRGHRCMGFLHFNQDNPDEYFYNGERIASLVQFMQDNSINVVVNQIAFNYWLLSEFLSHGGQQWVDDGGKVVSFMHFDPSGEKRLTVKQLFRGFGRRTTWGKVKRLGLLLYLPEFNRKLHREERCSFRYVYDHSDAYVVMSPAYIAPLARKAKIDNPNKVHVITNMLTFLEVATPAILKQKQNNVIVVARLDEKQKRLSVILKVWQRLMSKDPTCVWQLQIIGTGEDEPYYRQMVEHRRIPNVQLLGHRSPLEYYRQAKIFLMSSPREGWGLTITESMQNGVVPIVLNTSAVFRDTITDGVDGFLPDTPVQMAERLRQLILNPDLCSRMTQAALNSVTRFSPSAVGDSWERLLNNL